VNIVLLMLLLAQLEPEPKFSVAILQAQQLARNDLVNGILANNRSLAQTALNEKANLEDTVILSQGESVVLQSLSPRVYHYYVNGKGFQPLHLAAGLGETEICQLLIAGGAKQYAAAKGYDWIPAQFAARAGYPDLAKILVGIDPKEDHYRIEISLRSQKLSVYRDEEPFLTARISTGRHDKPTPPGNYLVTDKIRLERSSLYKVRMPYFLRLSFSEFGIHYGVNPGHPASHGCIRVGSEEMAQKIFELCPIGTLVRIE
jgi:hypothetical protein